MVRALLIALAGGLCFRLLAPHALAAAGGPVPVRIEDALTRAATLTATGLSLWYLMTAVMALAALALRAVAGARGRARVRGSLALEAAVRRFGAPLLRGGATFGLGLGVAVGAVPAVAASQSSLDELPTDLRPGVVSLEAAAVTVTATVTVTPGDSLWQIAARHLGPDASDAAIAREWPRWHAANASTIGPDPDLILPGQILNAPSTEVTT